MKGFSRVEAPRGEVFYFIKSNGTDIPERIKVRTPSLCNWTSVLNQAIGRQLADIPLLIAGMGPMLLMQRSDDPSSSEGSAGTA